MNERHGVYLVTGKREYRGIEPGAEFIARLDRGAEHRACHRGDITLLRHVYPTIEADLLEFPDGWLPAEPNPRPTRRQHGASQVGERSR